jgi:hypothetical protein
MTDEELTQAMTDAVVFGTGVMQDGKRIDPQSFFVQPASGPACEHCGMDPAALTEQLEQLVAINEAARADAKEAEAYAEELAGDQVDLCSQLIAAEDKLAKAVELLKEARQDLEWYVTQEWPKDEHPVYERKWERDMELCRRIDATLAEIESSEAAPPYGLEGEKG